MWEERLYASSYLGRGPKRHNWKKKKKLQYPSQRNGHGHPPKRWLKPHGLNTNKMCLPMKCSRKWIPVSGSTHIWVRPSLSERVGDGGYRQHVNLGATSFSGSSWWFARGTLRSSVAKSRYRYHLPCVHASPTFGIYHYISPFIPLNASDNDYI